MATTTGQIPNFGGNIIDRYSTTGGIDTVSSSVLLGQAKLRDAQNVNYFPIGGFQWRNGYIPLNTSPVSANACNGIYMARFSSGNQALLVCGGKLYSMSASLGGTWSDITNSTTVTTGSTYYNTFAILNDIVCMTDDSNTCWQTNSSGTTQVIQGSPAFTSALFNVEYQGYMFWGQTVESSTRYYDRLRFSDVNNPNSFTMLGSNNYMDISPKTGGDLRGAVNYNTFLYGFKRNAIYQIAFQPTQVNSSGVIFPFTQNPTPVVAGVGTQSHRSIVKFTTPITNTRQSGAELVFFVDQFGVPRIFDGRTTVQVGYTISQSRNTTITNLTNIDHSQLKNVWAINYPARNQVWCFMSQSNGQNDTCWVLDYTTDFVWGRHSFANTFACGAVFELNNGSWIPFAGDYAGTVYQHDIGTNDNGTAISSYVTFGDIFAEKPTIRSKWPWIEIKGTTGSTSQYINIDCYLDGSDTTSIPTIQTSIAPITTTWGTTGSGGTMTWGTSTWATAGISTTQKELAFDAKTVRVKLSNSTLNNTATIEGFAISAIPEGISQA